MVVWARYVNGQSVANNPRNQFVALTEGEIHAKAEATRMDNETIEQAIMRVKMDEHRRKDEFLILKVEEAEREVRLLVTCRAGGCLTVLTPIKRQARARKAREQAQFNAQLTEAKDIAQRQSQRQSLMPSEPSLYTNSEGDLEEKARHEQEEERRRLAREEAKFKEHMERRKLAMVDAILAEEGGTPLLDNCRHSYSFFFLRHCFSFPLAVHEIFSCFGCSSQPLQRPRSRTLRGTLRCATCW
jgi:hypothetical protein